MAITFKVDDVVPAAEKLTTRPLSEAMPEGALCLGRDAALPVIPIQGAMHPLMYAVHIAFSEHRPLRLSPDAVWLTIAHGFAQHVRLNAERLRHRFVSHTGRVTIGVNVLSVPQRDDAEGWANVISQFRAGIEKHIGQGIARLLTCDFSTTTEVDRVASEILLMDTVSQYFDFHLASICGIPEITLTGTPKDWRDIRRRIDVIGEFELDWWTKSLALIADGFVEAAEGRVNPEFWKGIYKPKQAYGPERITGWAARLIPYLEGVGTHSRKNPILEVPFENPRADEGPSLSEIPAALSEVLIRTENVGNQRGLAFIGGLVAVHQDEAGVLTPISGFMVQRHELDIHEVIERILREHRGAPEPADLFEGNAEQMAIMSRVGVAKLTFSAGDWQMRDWKIRDVIEFGDSDVGVMHWFDLPGARFIGAARDNRRRKEHYVLGDASRITPAPPNADGIDVIPRSSTSTQPFSELEPLGDSLAAILAYALDNDGAILPPEKRGHFAR